MNDRIKPVAARIARHVSASKVKVEFGTGAISPKVAIHRFKGKPPVKVEFGTGAISPKVAIHRAKSA